MGQILQDRNWSEHYIKKGDPSAPTYYIIRRLSVDVGLFSNYVVFAGHIKYALSNGYIPVIDMQNYPNQMLDPKLLGKENSWEYYFKQPFKVGVEQAYKGENILLSFGANLKDTPGSSGWTPFINNKNGQLDEWRTLIKWGLLTVQPELQKEIDELYNKLFSPNDCVLGVHLRGTDYVSLKAEGHPIPPPYRVCITYCYTKNERVELQ